MQKPEDLHRISTHSVDEKVMAMRKQLPRAGNASGTANFRKYRQNLSFLGKNKVHFASCAPVVRRDKLEDFAPIPFRRPSPNQIHHADRGNSL
jgi:hypothetical protein